MTVLPGLTSAASSLLSAATFGHRPWVRGIYAFGGTNGGGVFPSVTSGCERLRARRLAQSLCHSFESSMRCNNWAMRELVDRDRSLHAQTPTQFERYSMRSQHSEYPPRRCTHLRGLANIASPRKK